MDIFPTRKDIPLLASPGTPRQNNIIELTGADPKKTWVLLSFTSLNLDHDGIEKILHQHDRYEFFVVAPLSFPGSGIHSIDRHCICFADILASCDIVISKPGFGLVSECIVNQKPLIYSDRGDFAEYPYLVKGIESYLKNVHLPSEQLYAGDFEDVLKQIKNASEPSEELASGGAEMIAEELIRFDAR
jgi:L-arabinokinase